MKSFIIASLAGLALAAPAAMPQDSLDWDLIDSAPVPEVQGPGVQELVATVTYDAASVAASVYAEVLTNPVTTADSTVQKRGVNDACAKQPDGYGPVSTPDTDQGFLANPAYNATADAAYVPQGYSLVFSDLTGSVEGSGYLGLTTLSSFDTIQCQQLCDSTNGCYSFNVFVERDPSVNPADACLNPESITNYKCTLWGYQITAAAATNVGQWRRDFHVVIAGSNGYFKNAAPPAIPDFDGPVSFGGAIQANNYMGSRYYPGPYDTSLCAAACKATNTYSHNHPRSDGSYDACNFFNSYVLSANNAPQGTYCTMYTRSWGSDKSTNYGQYRGSDYYSVSQSYGYTLAVQDPGSVSKASP